MKALTKKIKLTYAQVKEALKAGFISPLNSEAKDSIEYKIEALARSMGVHKRDVRCLAQSMVNSMTKDGVTFDVYANLSDDSRNDMVIAYADFACKKFEAFATQYMTKPEARDSLHETLWAMGQ